MKCLADAIIRSFQHMEKACCNVNRKGLDLVALRIAYPSEPLRPMQSSPKSVGEVNVNHFAVPPCTFGGKAYIFRRSFDREHRVDKT